MWSQPARVARRLARWPVVLAILVTGLAIIGWDRVGRAALTAAGGTAEATWPALRLLWPALVVLAVAGLRSRSGRALLGRLRIDLRFSWLVSGLALAVFGLVVLSLLVFPGYLVQSTLNATGAPALGPAERLKAENDARTTQDSGQLDVVAMLCAMLGIRTSRLSRSGDRDSLYLATTNRLMCAAVNARPERYDGIVWSPHLRTGILLARCNGRTFWTGNINIRNG
jgi:hypothetical protein